MTVEEHYIDDTGNEIVVDKTPIPAPTTPISKERFIDSFAKFYPASANKNLFKFYTNRNTTNTSQTDADIAKAFDNATSIAVVPSGPGTSTPLTATASDHFAKLLKETEKKAQEPVKYSMSSGFLAQLIKAKISIALTSYQSSRLYLLGSNPKGGLMVNEEVFQRAMGLRYHNKKLYLASLGQIMVLENILAQDQWINEQYTQCFIPRRSYFTGHLDCHDVGITNDNRSGKR